MTRMIDVDLLVEADDNPNTMDKEHYDLLIKGMETHGFLQPVLVVPRGDGQFNIVDGHHRARAAKHLGIEAIPCVEANLDEQEQSALRLAMNRLRGEVDISKARGIVFDLATTHGWDLSDLASTGFTSSELEDLLSSQTTNVEDILDQVAAIREEEEPAYPVKVFTLEISFTDKADFTRCLKALKTAAGKGKELSTGLIHLVDKE